MLKPISHGTDQRISFLSWSGTVGKVASSLLHLVFSMASTTSGIRIDTASFATVKVSGQMGAIFFLSEFQPIRAGLTFSQPFWAWANQRACFWWEQPSWMTFIT